MYQWTELMQHFVVCILQYFLWYLCLLPLILPRLKLCKIEGLILIVMWLAGQVSSMSTLFSVISTYILSTIFKEFFRNLSHYRLSTNELGLQLTHLFRCFGRDSAIIIPCFSNFCFIMQVLLFALGSLVIPCIPAGVSRT